MNKTFNRLAAAIAVLLAIAAAPAARADTFPDHPVKLELPYGAGGGLDAITRILAQKLGDIWHQSVVVENKPGAGGVIGMQSVVNAPADGYTLLMMAGGISVTPSAYPNLPFNVEKDLAPISLVAVTPYVLAVRKAVPAHNVQELVALMKQKPGALNIGAPGVGTISHLGTEYFKALTGTQAAVVQYKGSPAALNGLLGGQVDVVMDTPAALMGQIKTGEVRALAVTTPKRSSLAPGIPTMQEEGVKGYDLIVWHGILVNGRTPPAIQATVHAALLKALADPELKKKFAELGMEVVTSSPKEFADLMHADIVKWGKVVQESNIQFQ
jgi:tripartite-type tricarboxylate transporter receptor subunit TctC